MKGGVQTHFQNTETDEGYLIFFFFFFLFDPVWDQTIGGQVHFKSLLPLCFVVVVAGQRKSFCSFRSLGNTYDK